MPIGCGVGCASFVALASSDQSAGFARLSACVSICFVRLALVSASSSSLEVLGKFCCCFLLRARSLRSSSSWRRSGSRLSRPVAEVAALV